MWWSRVSHRPTASQGGAIRVLTILVCLTTSLLAATLQDPPQLVSRNGVLNLRIHPGDRVELALETRSGIDTNLHPHGLDVSPSRNSDNVFIHIHPGQTFNYSSQ